MSQSRIKQALAEQWPRRTVKRVELRLPAPPSVNALTRNRTPDEIARASAAGRPVRGRARTASYRTWIQGAGAVLNAQRPGQVKGPYTLVLLVPRSTRADLGNMEKAVSDLLQLHGVVENDRRAEWFIIGWSDASDREALVIVNEGNGLAVPLAEPALSARLPIKKAA